MNEMFFNEPDTRVELCGLSRDELAAELVRMNEKPFRAKQLWHWIYHQGATDFAEMTTLAKDFRRLRIQSGRLHPDM